MDPETLVRLRIRSREKLPSHISELVGMSYDDSWTRGDLIKGSTMVRKENAWLVLSGLGRNELLEVHVAAILQRLQGVAMRINAISKTDEVDLSCVIYSSYVPGVNLSPSLLTGIAAMGATLDIDVILTAE